MRRGFWFAAGAAAGVYSVVKARRLAEALTPDGLRDRAAGITLGAQIFSAEVRAGMVEKESELRDRLGIGAAGEVGGIETLAGARSATTDPALAGSATADRALARSRSATTEPDEGDLT